MGTIENNPDLWLRHIPKPDSASHKYNRGHALIYGAPELTGASVLAASACARMGAGLVTVMGGEKGDLYRSILPAHIMVRDGYDWFNKRITAQLYGCGGLAVKPDLSRNIPTILDAAAMKHLPNNMPPHTILTPHQGEFDKYLSRFKASDSAVENAVKAATSMGCIVVLKGHETIIAAPDGKAVINKHSSPYLASGGTGDVLAGMITGLCAQGMNPFKAACAAVWIHGESGIRIGAGLVASDIPDKIPEILRDFA